MIRKYSLLSTFLILQPYSKLFFKKWQFLQIYEITTPQKSCVYQISLLLLSIFSSSSSLSADELDIYSFVYICPFFSAELLNLGQDGWAPSVDGHLNFFQTY